MSIQAVAWVLEDENVPGFARLVLISLANHADNKTGHSWPSVATIAKEAKISPRSVHTYLGALRRNGYIDIESGRHKAGAARSNNYWIRFDRPNDPWVFNKTNDDQCAPDSHIGGSEDEETQPLDCEPAADIADGISANRLQTKPSLLEPSESSNTDSSEPAPKAPLPVPPIQPQVQAPPGFDPTARQAELARQQAAEEARSKRMMPVIEGSEPWKAWITHGHKPSLVTTIIINGRHDRGWYFKSLFPPKSTGPPSPTPLMTSADQEELTKGI